MGGGFSLPAGTVTFLLTDIESSTRTWEADRAAMAPAVARHYELLDQAVGDHDGLRPVEQGEGDSIVAVFAKASDAVAAALVAQRWLLAELGGVFRVRMAVHTGEAMLRPDRDGVVRNYVGPAIIRTARLRACGHGGQVLVSGAVAELAADLLPDSASLLDLGSRRLRDLVRPERVFQLVHPDLPGEFPPLRSLEELPNTLPTPLTSLLGRHDELTTLPGVLATHRLVTLTGAGGVGKTRLGQQLAADLIDRYPGGTWWVELARAATSEAVIAAVADGVKLTLAPTAEPQQQLVAHLAGSERTLVVLDNCEHVIDTVAALTHQLLLGCPAVSILATSRERLDLPGERLWRVASLSAPGGGEVVTVERLDTFDAVALFLERSRQVRPNLVVDDHSAPHIAAICARLDGIPLAIELAAARSRSMPVDHVSAGLDDVFRLLTGGPRVVVPRQQTLLASIAWSYDLLVEADQAVLRRLSVCPTWFDVDAAEVVAADGDVARLDVLDCLTRLVDKNLVEFDDGTGRYRLLETIRQFGSDRLAEAGEDLSARRRYAEYWARRTIMIAGGAGNSYDPYAVLAAIVDITTMLDWAMAEDAELADRVLARSAPGLFGLSRWAEIQRACDWVVADRPRGADWARAVAAVSMGATMLGRFDVLQLTDEALRVAEEANDTTAVLHLRVGPSYVRLNKGDLSMVRALVIDGTAAGEYYPAFAAATGLAQALAYLGQVDELAAACRAAQLTIAVGFEIEGSAAGPARAVGDHLTGDLDAAVRRFPARKPAWEMITRIWAEVTTRVAVDRDDADLAERAISLMTDEDAAGSAVYRQLALWGYQIVTGDVERAADSAAGAVAVARTAFQRGHAACTLAATLAHLQRWDDTWAALRQVDDILADVTEPAPRMRSSAAVTRTMAALAAGRLGVADDAAHDALRIASDAALRLIHIDALEAVAAVAVAANDDTKAARLVAAADAERQRWGYNGRLTSAITDDAPARLATEHAAAWSEGAGLSLDEATELARRTRGPRGRPSFGFDALTPTERLVAEQVRHGRTNAEIATALLVTVPTVKTHLTNIFAKLGVRNRAELASLAATAERA